MTSPLVPSAPIDKGNSDDAADSLSRLVAGNEHLVTHPHLVTALLDAQASPEQAQAINKFVGGLSAKGRVEAARASGVKINLSQDEQGSLQAMKVNYSDVQYTQADAQAAIKTALGQQQKPKQDYARPSSNGNLLGDIWGGISDAAGAVGGGLTDAANFVGSGVAKGAEGLVHGVEDLAGGSGGSPGGQDPAAIHNQIRQQAADRAAKAAGYDPDNPLSMLAYQASGKDTLDLSALYANHDPAQVDAAIKYADDPKGYIEGLVQSNDTAQLQILQRPEFQDLVSQVNDHRATLGNLVTEGIDAKKHPEIKALMSTGIDVAVMFAADPTLVGLNAVKAIRMSKLMLDGVGDAERVRGLLSGATKGVYAAQVRRGFQSLLDNTAKIREGLAAGKDADVAAAYARIRATTPSLEHLTSDFLGGTRATGFDAEKGLTFEKAEPITTMEQASDYLSSTVGLVRVRAGRPLVESSLMPGQLSRFGFRWFRGNLAAANAARGIRRDSKLVLDLNKPGIAGRVLATADDTVDAVTGRIFHDNGDGTVSIIDANGARTGVLEDGEHGLQVLHEGGVTPVSRLDDGTLVEGEGAGPVIAPPEPQLPSALRAAHGELGRALFDTRKGFGPGAVAARTKLLASRIASYLPRTTTFATDDPNALRRVHDYAKMYLTPSHANLLAAAYAAGDEGVRKSILKGMELQTLHAAGLGTSEAGRAMIQHAEKVLDDSRYSSIPGSGMDDIIDVATGEPMRAAIHGGQLRDTVTLTGFQDIQKVAAKIGIWEATLGRVMKHQLVDNLMGIIKPGWLITGTNVVRNAGEDLFGAAMRGEYGDVVKAKTIAESKGLLPKRTKLGNVVVAPLARVAQMLRKSGLNPDDEHLGLDYIAKLDPDLMRHFADNWTHLHAGSMIDPAGLRDVDEVTKAGYLPRKLRMQRTGYGVVDTDGQQGAERLAQSLGIAINRTPEHVKAILDHIEDPDLFPLDHVVASLKSKANRKWVSQMSRASVYRGEDGLYHRAVTEADKDLALHQLADVQVQDLKYLLSDHEGSLNQELADYIRMNGKAPGEKWILDKLTDAKRPVTVHAPMYEPVPVEPGVTGLVGAISDIAGNGYRHLIERPIARISSMPIFLSHYGKARFEMRSIEQAAIDGGLSPEAADAAMQKLGMEMAFNRTVKYIDDAGLRTQMDVVGRNFFAFSRATTAFMRRWGTQFIEDPARLRKAMLTMEAAEHAGIVYTDPNGQKQFTFPGSGAAIDAIQHLEGVLSLNGRIPGLNVMQVPGVTPDLTGKVALLQPGLQNPLQMSLTPMVNMPMRAIFDLFPEHRQVFDEIDTFLNGQQGRGQNLLSEVMPTAIKKFSDALNADDRGSMTASATRQAILNLAAAGKLPGDGADPAQIDDFLQNLKVQVKNQLILRAVFGFFTPAPPGQPTEATSGSAPDWFYGALGVQGLSDEWKTLLNEAGGDVGKATTIWATLHPDKPFYTVSTTESTTKSATVASTAATESWLEGHLDFMHNYKGVSAYFIPKADQNGQFDLAAYNSQLELGLRQHKDLSSFYTDVRVKNAEDMYFQSLDSRDKALQQAGDNPAAQKRINDSYTAWYASFRAHNPLFAQKMSDFSAEVVTAQNQLSTLRRLVKDRPAGIGGLDVVANMIGAYDRFHAESLKYKGSTNLDQAMHASLKTQYNDWFQQAISEFPQFKGLYQGVFRTLDTKALQSMGGTL